MDKDSLGCIFLIDYLKNNNNYVVILMMKRVNIDSTLAHFVF